MKRKLLVTTMVLSMVLSSTMTVAAAESFSTPSTEEHHSESTPTEESSTNTTNSTSVIIPTEYTTQTITIPICNCQGSSQSPSDAESSSTSEQEIKPTYEEQHSIKTNGTISVADTEVKTSIAGVYAASSVQGCAVITSYANVRTALNLDDGQNPDIIVYDVNEIQSSAAMSTANAVAEFIGNGNIVASIYVDLCAKQDGKKIELSDGSVSMSVGLPKNSDTSKDYVVICIQTGGTYTVVEDQDVNPNTVTFDVKAGVGTYAFVAK